MTKFIGLAGKMGSGKDTIAQILLEAGIAHRQMSLAYGVKKHSKEIFDEEGREIWQWFGNTMRQWNAGVWISYLLRRLKWVREVGDSNFTVVISDIRYRNEAEWILNNGTLIYIDTDTYQRRVRIEDRDKNKINLESFKELNKHPSETELDFIQVLDKKHPNAYHFYNNYNLSYDNLKETFIKWYRSNIR